MTPQTIMPSRWYYLVPPLIIALGVALFFVITIKGVSGIPSRLTQMEAPGAVEMTFKEPGEYTIFYEHKSALNGRVYDTGETLSGLWLNVVEKETGQPVQLSQPSMSTTYTVGNREGVSVLSFNVERPGSYEVSAAYRDGRDEQGQPQVVLAVGHGVATTITRTVFGALGSMLGSIIVALVFALVIFIKRRRAKKVLAWGVRPAYPPALAR